MIKIIESKTKVTANRFSETQKTIFGDKNETPVPLIISASGASVFCVAVITCLIFGPTAASGG